MICSNGKTQREVTEETMSVLKVTDGKWVGDYYLGILEDTLTGTLKPVIIGNTIFSVFEEPVYPLNVFCMTSTYPSVVSGDIRENFKCSDGVGYTCVSLGDRAYVFTEQIEALSFCSWYLLVKYWNIESFKG